MIFNLDDIEVKLEVEDKKTILRTATEYRVFHRTMEDVRSTLENNYQVVKDQFTRKRGQIVSDADLDDVCLQILLFFTQTRDMGLKPNRKNMMDVLKNDRDDFARSSKEIIMNHFKGKYPSDFVTRCVFLLDISEKDFLDYVDRMDQFYNK